MLTSVFRQHRQHVTERRCEQCRRVVLTGRTSCDVCGLECIERSRQKAWFDKF
jgi:RNA polymerase subunit RPABC4/transcription elongation factor Spt4